MFCVEIPSDSVSLKGKAASERPTAYPPFSGVSDATAKCTSKLRSSFSCAVCAIDCRLWNDHAANSELVVNHSRLVDNSVKAVDHCFFYGTIETSLADVQLCIANGATGQSRSSVNCPQSAVNQDEGTIVRTEWRTWPWSLQPLDLHRLKAKETIEQLRRVEQLALSKLFQIAKSNYVNPGSALRLRQHHQYDRLRETLHQ
ncbi:hypothetical protein T492DRAFT_840652 [Pavlovales sp. CCMP2436]|nr:hypothetical protein T492DRAFT_840652 [Pavlovales sp. CCMP2436]